jgi:hypothetical protein
MDASRPECEPLLVLKLFWCWHFFKPALNIFYSVSKKNTVYRSDFHLLKCLFTFSPKNIGIGKGMSGVQENCKVEKWEEKFLTKQKTRKTAKMTKTITKIIA